MVESYGKLVGKYNNAMDRSSDSSLDFQGLPGPEKPDSSKLRAFPRFFLRILRYFIENIFFY